MNFDILNNKPLEFFNESGELMGKIFISGSTGDLFIAPVSGTNGDVVLGDRNTVGNVEIGLPSAETTLKLMGGGLISANGQTLTIGDVAAGDSVIVNGPITASNILSASYALTASHALNAGSGGGGSGIFEATGSIFATTNVLEVTGSMTLINTASNSTSSNTLSIEGSGSVSGSGIFDVRGSVGQLFEVQDGLDGVLMSVNDISGIPILTVSSSGDVILAEGSTLQGTAATASHVAGVSEAFPFTGNALITGDLDITGSGDDIFKVRSSSGSLFSVDDGLDGILMSVNDISGLPLFEISSSGDVELIEGNISGSAASTASFGHYIGVSAFPFTGDAQITGSLTISGSLIPGGRNRLNTNNVVIGRAAGENMSISTIAGIDNTLIGAEAGNDLTNGNNNVLIGYKAGEYLTTSQDVIAIGKAALGADGTAGNALNYVIAIGANAGGRLQGGIGDGDHHGIYIGRNAGINIDSNDGNRNNILIGHRNVGPSSQGHFGEGHLRIGQGMDSNAVIFPISASLTTGSVLIPQLKVDSVNTANSASGTTLSVEGSGSNVFEVIGSEGTLFAIDDSLSGSLFVVTNKSGIPRFEVFSDGKIEKQGNNIQDESFTWFMA